MFNPESEVPSLELCKKLKDLGYPQEGGGWYWASFDEGTHWELHYLNRDTVNPIIAANMMDADYIHKLIKAPTVTEMWGYIKGEALLRQERNGTWSFMLIHFEDCISPPHYFKLHERSMHKETPFDAVGEALIWLAENGYVRFGDERKTSL